MMADDVVALSTLIFFFFNDTATTEIYTLSLHDALPISHGGAVDLHFQRVARRLYLRHQARVALLPLLELGLDRKSTRLNSSHGYISYAVFCLKKKKNVPEMTAPPSSRRVAQAVS